MQRHDRESRRKGDERTGDERMAGESCVQAYRYRPRAVRHVGATKVFYACQMRVLVSDLTLNSLDDPRDRLAFESNSSYIGLEATYQRNCAASVAFSVLFRASAVRRPDQLHSALLASNSSIICSSSSQCEKC